MQLLLHRLKFVGLIAALSLLVGACATSPPKQLEKARTTYQEAQQSNAAKYAPTELAQARKALLRAEQAFEEEGDEDITRTLSYVALRRAQEAMAQGEVNYLVTTREAKQQELFTRTEQARQQYQRELVRQRQVAQMNQQQLEQKRQQLEQARQQLEQQDMTREEQLQREREYGAAIQKLEVEIQRRKQAEKQLEQARAKLEDVATVRQEDGRGQVITLDNSVLFEVGESELMPNARQRLKQVAEVLQMQQDRTITIEGHTDSQGTTSLNERLSEQRADAVKNFLVSRGIDSSRVRTVGYGEERPVASNQSPEGRAMNRRVEIVLPTDTAVGGGPEQQNKQQNQQNQQNQPEEGIEESQPNQGEEEMLQEEPEQGPMEDTQPSETPLD